MRRFFLLALVLPHSILRADVDVPGLPGFALFGHLRLRYERDSDRNTGQPARAKLLAGNYLGVKYNPNAAWTFCTRLRAGAIDNPRARMVTVYRFDDSPYGDRGVFQDIYYVAWKAGRNLSLTAGRHQLPFWSNSLRVWDNELNPLGVTAVSGMANANGQRLSLRSGLYRLPDGIKELHGDLYSAQVEWSADSGRKWPWKIAGALHRIEGKPGARHLTEAQGRRDYMIGVLSAYVGATFNKLPASLGFDWIRNFQNYSADSSDPVAAQFHDDRSGVVLAASLGENRKSGDWRFQYSYAYVEMLAVNSYYANGAISRIERSNIKGHDFQLIRSLSKSLTLTGRCLLSKQIVGAGESTRIRAELNYRF